MKTKPKTENWEKEFDKFTSGSVQQMEKKYVNCWALPFDYPKDLKQFIKQITDEAYHQGQLDHAILNAKIMEKFKKKYVNKKK